MQTYALFCAYFWNDSSSRCTSEVYWSGLISAGTPGGYDFSQILSITRLCLNRIVIVRAAIHTFEWRAWLHYAFAIECDAIGQRPHKQALLARLERALYGMAAHWCAAP